MSEIRLLTEHDASVFWHFRLSGLEEAPQAFGESAEEMRASSVETTAERLRASSDASFVLGAFIEERLVGTAGFFREPRVKARHKGRVWGVYVDPAHRGAGIASEIMRALLARVSRVEGILQVSLTVATTQLAARRLYDRLGFQVFGVERRALKVGEAFVDEELRVLMIEGESFRPERLDRVHS